MTYGGDGKKPLIDVVIPALNESDTIGDVIRAFANTTNIGKIIVVNDIPRSDRTAAVARKQGAIVVKGPGTGKGQAMMRGLREVVTHRVIFADADLSGFTKRHAEALAMPAFGMLVGYRDLGRFNFLYHAGNLPPIAGERSLPAAFARSLPLEGYGAEMQINNAATRSSMRKYHFVMRGVTGRRRAGPARMIDVLPYMNASDSAHYNHMVKWLGAVG